MATVISRTAKRLGLGRVRVLSNAERRPPRLAEAFSVQGQSIIQACRESPVRRRNISLLPYKTQNGGGGGGEACREHQGSIREPLTQFMSEAETNFLKLVLTSLVLVGTLGHLGSSVPPGGPEPPVGDQVLVTCPMHVHGDSEVVQIYLFRILTERSLNPHA